MPKLNLLLNRRAVIFLQQEVPDFLWIMDKERNCEKK